MTFLHDLSPWTFGTLTILAFVSLAVSGLLVTRTWTRRRGLHALVDNGVVGWMFSAILVMYAIAVGLIAVATWGNESRAGGVASEEAGHIAKLFRDVSGYPEPVRSDLRERLVQYVRFVIEEAWPAHRRGEILHEETERLTAFQAAFYAFEPRTDGGRIVHGQALRAFNDLVQARSERLEAVDASVPGTLWSVVLIGAVIAIAGSYVFATDSLGPHATMTALLAAMIGLLVFFIASTDRPYRGATGVAPAAYELVLRDLMRPPARTP